MESINQVSQVEAVVESKEKTPGGVTEILQSAFEKGNEAHEFDLNGRRFGVTDAATALFAAVQGRRKQIEDAISQLHTQTT